MLTARSVSSAELAAVSALHHIAPDLDSAFSKADEIVEQITGGAPGAQADVKTLVNLVATESESQHIEAIKGYFLEMMKPCEEGKYGLECFQKKVKPDWDTLRGKVAAK
jgi:enoyl-CoA hydratase/carnithine racemase